MASTQEKDDLLREEYGYIQLGQYYQSFDRLSETTSVCRVTPLTVERLKYVSLTKMGERLDTRNFIIISASSLSLSDIENAKRTKVLKDMLSKGLYAYIPVYGGYIESDGDSKKETFKTSFFVYAYNYRKQESAPAKDIFDFGLRLIQLADGQNEDGSFKTGYDPAEVTTFGQESFLYKEEGKDAQFVKRDGSVDMSFSCVAFDDTAEKYFTALIKDNSQNKRFRFVESYINAPTFGVSSSFHRHLRREAFFSDVTAPYEVITRTRTRRFTLL